MITHLATKPFYNSSTISISFIKCCFTGLVPHWKHNAVSGELTSKFIKLTKLYGAGYVMQISKFVFKSFTMIKAYLTSQYIVQRATQKLVFINR